MSDPKTYPHLSLALPTRETLYHCDLCFASEVDDITSGKGRDLIPMYRDSRDGCVICRDCAESGRYLEIETATDTQGADKC